MRENGWQNRNKRPRDLSCWNVLRCGFFLLLLLFLRNRSILNVKRQCTQPISARDKVNFPCEKIGRLNICLSIRNSLPGTAHLKRSIKSHHQTVFATAAGWIQHEANENSEKKNARSQTHVRSPPELLNIKKRGRNKY